MSDPIYVIAKLQARAGKEEALKSLIQPLIEPTRREKGCRSYLVMQGLQEPALVTLVEEWETEADLNTHLALPHLEKVFSQLPDLLGAPPEIIRYKKVG